MLRRAPTSISLSNRDVTEHLENIERKKRPDRENDQPKKGHQVSSAPPTYELTDSLAKQFQKKEKNEVTVYEYGKANQQRALRTGAPPFRFPREIEEEGPWEESQISDIEPEGMHLGELLSRDPCADSEVDYDLNPIDRVDSSEDLEEPPVIRDEDPLQYSSETPRNTYDYGGFVAVNADQLSSFIPQDISTPRNNEIPEGHRLRYRYPLPRSPLFLAQGANSPERYLTTSLTPRVTSYGTPGLLLSQPARRPRSYRPRTISYSFEESERASATYEQFQGSDSDSTGGRLPDEPRRSLHGELEAGSSQSASLESNMPSSPPDFSEASLSRIAQATPGAERIQRAQSPSPQLPLPPPFSAVRRNISVAASLPSAPGEVSQSRSPTPVYDLPQLQASPVAASTTSSHEEDDAVYGSSGILRNLAALPLRLLSVYRSRSPFQTLYDGSGSGHDSPLALQSPSQGPEEAPTSARHQFQIYDDSMPAISQPQTPLHLPEARHQSRFHPSYTAPASGRMDSARASRSEVTRRRGARSDSPTGMETPGFQGLYGGQENADDDVMFDRASQRLWALSSARRHGRSMSNTPDREPSFAD